jgi:hypothetical protein
MVIKKSLDNSGARIATVLVDRVFRLRAAKFARYSSFAAAEKTRLRVFSDTRPELSGASVRDTVAVETPAATATSRMVAIRGEFRLFILRNLDFPLRDA